MKKSLIVYSGGFRKLLMQWRFPLFLKIWRKFSLMMLKNFLMWSKSLIYLKPVHSSEVLFSNLDSQTNILCNIQSHAIFFSNFYIYTIYNIFCFCVCVCVYIYIYIYIYIYMCVCVKKIDETSAVKTTMDVLKH